MIYNAATKIGVWKNWSCQKDDHSTRAIHALKSLQDTAFQQHSKAKLLRYLWLGHFTKWSAAGILATVARERSAVCWSRRWCCICHSYIAERLKMNSEWARGKSMCDWVRLGNPIVVKFGHEADLRFYLPISALAWKSWFSAKLLDKHPNK